MLRPLKLFSRRVRRTLFRRAPTQHVSLELVGPCNLHCAYCLRSESMLYGKASFLPREKVRTILEGLKTQVGRYTLGITGGEPTLHPEFGSILDDIGSLGLDYKLITNGWHFQRALPHILRTRKRLASVSFSIDGASREAHDGWRGKGSFDRMMRAVTACYHYDLPFQLNVVLRRDTKPQMEAIALLGARFGAKSVNFGSMLPTSAKDFENLALSEAEERDAEREGLELSRALRMMVKVPFVLYRRSGGAHCYPLAGRSMNIDHQGRLTLCANLSFFRGHDCAGDVVGEASGELPAPMTRLSELQRDTLAARDGELQACAAAGTTPDQILASPCLTCLKGFGKLGWAEEARA